MKPEEVCPEEIETASPTEKPNVYIDIDGKWKLELGGAALGEETNVDEEKTKNEEEAEVGSEREEEEEAEEECGEVKWCQPVSVISDDSSSSPTAVAFRKALNEDLDPAETRVKVTAIDEIPLVIL